MSQLAFISILWFVCVFQLNEAKPVSKIEGRGPSNYIDIPDLYNNAFSIKRPSLVWVKNDPRDGIFTYTDPLTKDILLESVENGKKETLVQVSDLKIGNRNLDVNSFEISHDAEYLLLKTNVTSQWRHSTLSNMYIYKVADKLLFPLSNSSTIDTSPTISYAAWSPTGHKLAYIVNNDIYITDFQSTSRITFDGSNTIFNGKPDWVYEEEVFEKDFTLWWSPDSTHIAYLRFNETEVPEYHMQYYTSTNNPYPEEISIKYPKAGSPNPLVSLHVYSIDSNITTIITSNPTTNPNFKATDSFIEFLDTDKIITDVVWSTDSSTHLLFKQANRIQDHEITSLVTIGKYSNETYIKNIRAVRPNDGGWIEPYQTMVYLPNQSKHDTSNIKYLDIIDNGQGFMHLAIISVDKPNKPIWLTSGDWEVVSGTVVVDHERQFVHYMSTEKSHLERHLYRLDLSDSNPALTKKCITCPDNPEDHAYYSANFSPKHGYYILQYQGPDVPTTVIKKVDNSSFETVLENNSQLKVLLHNYELPKTRMTTVKSSDIEMSAMEVLPPDFDTSKKYPVLFHVYGGPGSQLVDYKFDLSWDTVLASKLNYIVVKVDGRGTGFKGRKYRSPVRGRLGELEANDQISAAKIWSELQYVDSSRMAIWGWSYGGYLTSKVIEANSDVFVAGLAVAPVTDWRFYDSIYTERYMLTPMLNPEGYVQSAVNNMTGFKDVKYLLVHGTGDDNVHFQNSAVLVDKLTQANIQNYQVQFFSDNNHSIRYHNANQNLFKLLTKFLLESFGGEAYLRAREESNNKFSGSLSAARQIY